MRLLNVQTFRLEEYFGNNMPLYAILSHTREQDEVLFSDINGPLEKAKAKAGFRKVQYTCDQAVLDGLGYVWVDTCCIQKSSSAELSEAINSMYQWYREATICYAYMSDVRDGSEQPILEELQTRIIRNATYQQEIRQTSFARARWWTRGWTLQELLAPGSVLFYSSNWQLLGSRRALAIIIHTVTGIDASVLSGMASPWRLSVARRLSWAAGRQTARIEDITYSLLGLLGINMPLLYGEGESAFRRLREEIIKSTDDHSIFAWRDRRDRLAEDSLLAPSPFSFGDCGDIVSWKADRDARPAPYILTNTGLSITLRIAHVDDATPLTPFMKFRRLTASHAFAVLNCRRESDFSACLGIMVQRTTSVDSTDAIDPDIIHYKCANLRGERIASIHLNDKLLATPSTTILLSSGNPPRLPWYYLHQRVRPCWFRCTNQLYRSTEPPRNGSARWVTDFSPRCYAPVTRWNEEMTVHFEFPLEYVHDCTTKTAAVQYSNQAGVVFSVYVRYYDAFSKPYGVTVSSMALDMSELSEDGLLRVSAKVDSSVNLIGGVYSVTVKLHEAAMMGKIVDVVDILVSDTRCGSDSDSDCSS